MDRPRYWKLITMALLVCVDIVLNSSLDYDVYNVSLSTSTAFILLAVQLVVQISMFLVLFLSMAETFLFRVGLLNLLLSKFKTVLIMHPIYMALTVGEGIYRANNIASYKSLWVNSTFLALVYLQKAVALIYYVVNIRATTKLGDPVFFDKDAWISLVRQERHLYQNLDRNS